MRCFVFDMEANGYIEDATRIWCASFLDIKSEEMYTYQDTGDIIRHLEKCTLVVGHNIVGYDFPLLNKLYPENKLSRVLANPSLDWCFDTFEVSQALRPDRGPKGHSVETWAARLGMAPKIEINDWLNLPVQRYIERCEQDVTIELEIFRALQIETNCPELFEQWGV